ncbi:MAG: TIGR03643 family protein [Gammaproteobacteria bacterium TMED222]|nr:MAG: TIGR03643 family protein [Gammaproteobacteria bacterium TMED222]|tara:strand:- start:209 stop:466 length:258 start_codon:yes stop_codon:yes gene_type:complete
MDQDNLNRIIEMAWEDRTPFDVIYKEFNITQNDLERLMRNNLKPSSFKLWRKRVSGRKTKHVAKRSNQIDRHKCDRQGKLVSKRR